MLDHSGRAIGQLLLKGYTPHTWRAACKSLNTHKTIFRKELLHTIVTIPHNGHIEVVTQRVGTATTVDKLGNQHIRSHSHSLRLGSHHTTKAHASLHRRRAVEHKHNSRTMTARYLLRIHIYK